MSAEREYDVGDQPRCRIRFFNADGQLTNPTTVVVKTRSPSGTETTYTSPNANIVNSSTGVWVFTFPAAITESGDWTVRGKGTAGLITADEVVLKVRESRFATP